jgi:SPP1 gp7 family putative phage head morphogenesis protein
MTPFERPMRLEVAYERAISKLLQMFFKIPSFGSWNEVQEMLQHYHSTVKFLSGFATQLARNMVTHVAVSNAQSWREAAHKAGKGSLIYDLLRREMNQPKMRDRMHFLIQSNAQFISTVPQNVAARAVHYVQQEQMKGRRSEDIMKDLAPYMRKLRNFEIRRIARTEVSKADTAITRTRAEALGLNWYKWSTSHDARVRKSHRHMSEVLVNWDDPPSPELLVHEKSVGSYNAGNVYNCRCIALPLVSVDDVNWPCRVYSSSRITQMSQSQFMKIAA